MGRGPANSALPSMPQDGKSLGVASCDSTAICCGREGPSAQVCGEGVVGMCLPSFLSGRELTSWAEVATHPCPAPCHAYLYPDLGFRGSRCQETQWSCVPEANVSLGLDLPLRMELRGDLSVEKEGRMDRQTDG